MNNVQSAQIQLLDQTKSVPIKKASKKISKAHGKYHNENQKQQLPDRKLPQHRLGLPNREFGQDITV